MADDGPLWPDRLFADMERSGPTPLYYAISSRLEEAIRGGDLPPGSRLENEIAISERLGVSRPTVRRAIQELVDRGFLVRRRGIGTQVVQGQMSRPVELTSLFDDLRSSEHTPTTTVLSFGKRAAPAAVAEKLGIAEGEDVLSFRRLRSMDGTPVAILRNDMPLTASGITEESLQERGLYQILRSQGISLRVASQTIGARRAVDDEAELLDIDRGGPVLTMARVAYDDSGQAVEYGEHCYRPDLYHFETTLVAK